MFRGSRPLLSSSVVVSVVAWLGGAQIVPGPADAAPTAAEASGTPTTEVIAVNVRGEGPQEPSAPPGRYVRTFEVYPITGGERMGTVVQDFAFTSATTGDHIMTFRFADGQFVNHTVLSFAPDSAHSGFVFTGLHPKNDTIVPERGTGRYAGRSGRVRMKGWHDVNRFPDVAVLDDFYVIEFDPAS